MHGVAAEIAQEVTVLFQHNDFDPSAGKQEGVDHAGGTATDNTDLGLQGLRHGLTLPADRPAETAAQFRPWGIATATACESRPAAVAWRTSRTPSQRPAFDRRLANCRCGSSPRPLAGEQMIESGKFLSSEA